MRALAFLAVVAACGGDDSAGIDHTEVACGPSWGSGAAQCEMECVDVPSTGSGNSTCKISFDFDPTDGQPGGFCPSSLAIDGGCCVPLRDKITWMECE
jgi:hypothetical protein